MAKKHFVSQDISQGNACICMHVRIVPDVVERKMFQFRIRGKTQPLQATNYFQYIFRTKKTYFTAKTSLKLQAKQFF